MPLSLHPKVHKDIPNTHNTLLTLSGIKANSGEQTQALLRVWDEINMMSLRDSLSAHKFRATASIVPQTAEEIKSVCLY